MTLPPIAKRIPTTKTLHGRELTDDYAWMHQKGTEDVEAYLNAENTYAETFLGPLKGLQDKLYDEMLSRIKETDMGVPIRRGVYDYYSRTVQGLQYPIYCRSHKDTKVEEVLLDTNTMGHDYVSVGAFVLSDDQTLLAYSLDTTGFREYTLYVKELATGKLWGMIFTHVTSASFSADGNTLYYVVEDPKTKRPYLLSKYVYDVSLLASGRARIEDLYEEKDEMFALGISKTKDLHYNIVTSASKTTSEARIMRRTGDDTLTLFAPRVAGNEYYVDHRWNDTYDYGKFVIHDNSTGPNFRVALADGPSERTAWRELIGHRTEVMLDGISCFRDWIVLSEREGGLTHVRFYCPEGEGLHEKERVALDHRIPVDEELYTIGLYSNPEWVSHTFRYSYESPLTPDTVYSYDPVTREKTLLKQFEVPNYDRTKYDSKRIYATAGDGTKIPVSLVFQKGTVPDGTRPMYLHGYGSYGISYDVGFSSSVFSLIDRGVIVATAHIRGGGEMGKVWHDTGKMKVKMNTFTDFIAVSEMVLRDGWAKKDGLVIEGGSAGGLLMGAVVNMRPDLFRGVLAHVPFVDVINTMLDETLPLTVGEFEEWGNPKKPEDFEVMIKYSPYENVMRQAYPAMFVRTSYNDSQVMYWEPAKWVAKLRTMKIDGNPLIMKTHMEPAGHGGKSGRYEHLKDAALDYAWVLGQIG